MYEFLLLVDIYKIKFILKSLDVPFVSDPVVSWITKANFTIKYCKECHSNVKYSVIRLSINS